jgi:hypothetical protein
VAESVVIPLLQVLGFGIDRRTDDRRWCALGISSEGGAQTTALVVGYNQPLASAWRESVRSGVAADARWAFCSNGVSLRLVDARRTWSRDHLEFHLGVLGENQITQSMLWSLARAEALTSPAPADDSRRRCSSTIP